MFAMNYTQKYFTSSYKKESITKSIPNLHKIARRIFLSNLRPWLSFSGGSNDHDRNFNFIYIFLKITQYLPKTYRHNSNLIQVERIKKDMINREVTKSTPLTMNKIEEKDIRGQLEFNYDLNLNISVVNTI